MTDLEITKLCAEAMGWDVVKINPGVFRVHVGHKKVIGFGADWYPEKYAPLTDDAQAMSLVKKCRLFIESCGYQNPTWTVAYYPMETTTTIYAEHADLNRAICECVAKKQKAKA